MYEKLMKIQNGSVKNCFCNNKYSMKKKFTDILYFSWKLNEMSSKFLGKRN